MKHWGIMVIAFIIMLIINGLGSAGYINGQSQAEISNKLDVLFTPDGYVFSIWGLIYLLLIIWLFIQYRRFNTSNQTPSSIVYLFLATCLLNVAWLFTWHYEQFVIAQIMMFLLLFTLLILYMRYPKNDKSFGGRLPFSLYTGWISVAAIANMSYTLKHYDISLSIPEVGGTIGLIIIAVLLAIATLYRRHDPFYALVFVWAFIGIGTVNTNSILVASAFIGAIIVALAILSLLFVGIKKSKLEREFE